MKFPEKPDNTNKLEKNLSPMNVLSLAVGCMIGWGAFMLPGETLLPKAGPVGSTIAVIIAVLLMVIIANNYSFMMHKFPVTGGAFAYTREAFGVHHSFICSWFLSLSYLSIIPLNGTALALICKIFFPKALQFGFHYSVAGYTTYLTEIILAMAVLILFAFLSIKGVKFAGRFENILVFSLVLGIGILTLFCFFPNSPSDFKNLKPAFSPDYAPTFGILSIVAVAPWALAGFETIPQAVEEFKFSVNKTKFLMILSIVTGGSIYGILNLITAVTIPEKYSSWVEYIKAVPTLKGLETLPTFNAAQLLLGKIGLIFLGLAVLSAILSSIIGFYMATSRLLYSMACSSLIPKFFSVIHPKYKTPANAIFFTMVVSLLAIPFGRTALNWIVNMSSVGASIGVIYTSLATLKYAKKEKVLSVKITAVVGFLAGLLFMALLLIPIKGSVSSLNHASYICLIVWTLLGIVFHLYTYLSHKKLNKTR